MAYVIRKRIKGHDYYYLVACRWINKKPRQVFLEYFGKALPNAEILSQLKKKHAKKTPST